MSGTRPIAYQAIIGLGINQIVRYDMCIDTNDRYLIYHLILYARTLAIRTTVVPIKILIRTIVVLIRILIRTTGITNRNVRLYNLYLWLTLSIDKLAYSSRSF